MRFCELENLTDADLLSLLREVPNETLLLALSNEGCRGVTQRICEVLSFEGTKYFLEDLGGMGEVLEKDRQENQEHILNIALKMMEEGHIDMPKSERPRLLAS